MQKLEDSTGARRPRATGISSASALLQLDLVRGDQSVRAFFLIALLFVMPNGQAKADALSSASPAIVLQALLREPAPQMDLAGAKLAIDKFVDPTIDNNTVLAEID